SGCRACTAASNWTCADKAGACANGGTCMAGICCPADQTACGGKCFDLNSDEGHCGQYPTSCDDTQTCMNGACTLIRNPPTREQCELRESDDLRSTSNADVWQQLRQHRHRFGKLRRLRSRLQRWRDVRQRRLQVP